MASGETASTRFPGGIEESAGLLLPATEYPQEVREARGRYYCGAGDGPGSAAFEHDICCARTIPACRCSVHSVQSRTSFGANSDPLIRKEA